MDVMLMTIEAYQRVVVQALLNCRFKPQIDMQQQHFTQFEKKQLCMQLFVFAHLQLQHFCATLPGAPPAIHI